jgi:hypothetical protein
MSRMILVKPAISFGDSILQIASIARLISVDVTTSDITTFLVLGAIAWLLTGLTPHPRPRWFQPAPAL